MSFVGDFVSLLCDSFRWFFIFYFLCRLVGSLLRRCSSWAVCTLLKDVLSLPFPLIEMK